VIEERIAAATPDAADPAAAAGRLDAERIRLVSRAMVRTPLGVLPATAFIAYIMTPHFGAFRSWGWMAATFAIWCVRAGVYGALLRSAPPPHRQRYWIRHMVATAALGGLVGGSAAILFFSAPPLESALLTMVICGWCAAGVAVSGALPLAFCAMVTLFLLPLAVAWLLSGIPQALPVAGLLILFMFLLMTFARDSAELVGRTLRVGFENEDLARRLRAREAEAHAARERAESASLSKSVFLAAASHDLRQPLHALSLLLFTLQQRTHDPEATELLKKVAISADSLDSLFKGLLDLSRLDAGSVHSEPRALALGPMLKRLENDFRPITQAKGLAFASPASDTWVKSDREMLERVLRNLLDNAVKYTERGGIAIRVEETPQSARIAVHDSGVGIDPAHRERIFEEYYQIRNPARDRRQGIGLGLAIVKRMCDLLGHSLRVDSAPGQGSIFEVTVPRCAPEEAGHGAGERPSAASVEALRGLVIAVVEDDPEVQEAMRTLLSEWACRPVVAATSEEVLSALDSRGLTPDAVLADYRLAAPSTGIDAIAALFARYGEIPAAIITGEINAADLEVPQSMSIAVMQKPMRAEDICDWLLTLTSNE
jgi:signal transduction histidine kinase/CheY-like chemotaxis protein